MHRIDFYRMVGCKRSVLEWAMQQGIIEGEVTCIKCRQRMNFVKRECAADGYVWQCNTTKCKKNRRSVREGSLFSRSHLPIAKALIILYEWARGEQGTEIANDINVHRGTVVEWTLVARKLVAAHLSIASEQIGGAGKIVEIDETLVARRKFNVGRVVSQQWLFGGIVRGSDPPEMFLELVPDRTRETLIAVLKRRVRQESRIFHDGWRSYMRLGEDGFDHSEVNHKRNFIKPSNRDVHTQSVESMWSRLKTFMRRHALRNRLHLDEYLMEFAFRETVDDVWEVFLTFMKTIQ